MPQVILVAMEQPQYKWPKDSLKALLAENTLLFSQLSADVRRLLYKRAIKQQWYEEQQNKFVHCYMRNPDIPPTCSVENEILYSGNPLVHKYAENLLANITKLSSTDCVVESQQRPINILNVPAALGLPELIQQKCAEGANPNKISSWPSPLDIAALFGHAQCVAALLQAGAQNYRWERKCLAAGVYVNNNSPKTERQIFFNRTMQLPMYDERGKIRIGPIEVAALQGHVEVLRHLLHHEPWKTEENEDNVKRFCRVCLVDHRKAIRTLIRAGWTTEEIIFRPNIWTLLHYSALFNRSKDVRVLCDFGANINAIDRRGHTPLKIAQNLHWQETIAVLEDAQRNRAVQKAQV